MSGILIHCTYMCVYQHTGEKIMERESRRGRGGRGRGKMRESAEIQGSAGHVMHHMTEGGLATWICHRLI